jgi:small subunit ribosomal protein S1
MNSNEIEKNSPGAGEVTETEKEDFAAMLEQSSVGERLSPGQKVRAKVVSVSEDLVYIDTGGKSEGAVDLAEFVDKEGVCNVHEGDEIEAFFVTVQDGLMKFTTLVRGYSAVTLTAIKDAHRAGIPVNGEVKQEVKGGYEVSVGGVRCFCPFSQIDLKSSRENGAYVGRTFPFMVLEYGEDGKNIVVSRRVLLEQEKQAKVEELKKSLAVGMEVPAVVKSIRSFGAFVDLGGVEGLIPASEMSWDRSANPGDVLSVGQNVTVKVISLEWDKDRLALSLKAMQPDPWAAASEKYHSGDRVSGLIVRLTSFGAFVRLDAGVDGLIHISNLGAGRRINHPKEVVEVGQWVEAYVLSVDPQGRRISLSMQPKVEPAKIVLPSVGEVLEGTVEKVMPFGVFVKFESGLSGLIPNMEMGTAPNSDHKRMFPPGAEMRTVVIDVDTAGNKVRLSRKAALEEAAQDEFNQYKESLKTSSGSSGGLGSFGELLKAKLEEKKSKILCQ